MPISTSQLILNEPSESARRLLWHVLSLGVVSRDEPERHEGFDKPGVFLFAVAGGAGRLVVGKKEYALDRGGRCWLLDLREPRIYLPAPGRPLLSQGIRFRGPGVEAWLEMMRGDPVFDFSGKPGASPLRRSLRRLRDLLRHRREGCEWGIHLVLTGLLGDLAANRRMFSASRAGAPPAVARVIEVVLANPARDWKALELAALAGVSYSRLREQFRAAQRQTLHAFLQQTRLDQARQLLGDRRLSIKQVAERLNFSSEFYFSHFFRRATGMSPRQFRDSSRA
ncbi:MAG: AraC family transcriptional regulator [Pedosphaera sp.]|nr:AraC family transcriptional regulator [Pedosphaera sp.]